MSANSNIINISVTFKNLEASDPLKTYASDKVLNTLQKFVHSDTEAHVVLKVEKNRQIADVFFHSDGHDFRVAEESDNMYASVDTLINTLSQQLRKHKEKLTKHH